MRITRRIKRKQAAIFCLAFVSAPFVMDSQPVFAAEPEEHEAIISTDKPFSLEAKKEPELNIQDDTVKDEPAPIDMNKPAPVKPGDRESQTDANVKEYFKRYDGKTIVAIFFEGAGNQTLPTLQRAVVSHIGDKFDTEAALRDLNVIKNVGYFYDAYQTIREVPEGVMLTYHVLENPILKDIDINGNTVIETDDLEKIMTVKRGEVLNSNTLHDNMAALQEKYRGDGYIMMKITDMNVDTDGVLHLKINEGVLEGYKVTGNKKTKEKVILREMRQKVGEPFNANLARRSMERVYNLGFFEDVNTKMLSGVEPNAVIMEIEVKERRTGTFGVGAGYSTRDGFLGMVSIGDKNFRGRGDAVSISYEKSADDRDAHGFSFSYKHPWIDKRETAASIKIFNRTYEYADYDTDGGLKERYMRKYSGGEITISRPHSEYSKNYFTIRQRKDKYVRHVSSGKFDDRSTPQWQNWRNDNFGTTRSIEYQHVTDTRDNIYNPSRGQRVLLSAEFGGLLGGDFNFQKFQIDHMQFYKAGNHSQVWALRGAYGLGYGELTEFNQFRVGGQDSIRGYRDDQFRGNRMLLATLEYRFPLARKVQGILFTDYGGAWESGFVPDGNDLYGSVGMGVALNTPFGPLRLDYGRGSQGGRFHFNIGGSF